jgi:hypothetical protein
MAIIIFFTSYLFAPAIAGMMSPKTGIHGATKIIAHPYLSSR